MSEQGNFGQIIYGVPLEEGDAVLDLNSAEFGDDLIPTVGCYSYPYGDHDFEDIIEILAHIDSDNEYSEQVYEVTASPLPLPVPLPSHLPSPYPVASAEPKMPIVTYAYPEQGFSGEDVQAHPVENHPYPTTYPKSYPHPYPLVKTFEESKFDEESKFGEQFYYENSVKGDTFDSFDGPFVYEAQDEKEWARGGTGGDVWGWADSGDAHDIKAEMLKKKHRRRYQKPLYPPPPNTFSSSPQPAPSYLNPHPSSIPTHAYPTKPTSARQVATAKREREGGRFKRARTKWVSVPDLFKTSHPNTGSL